MSDSYGQFRPSILNTSVHSPKAQSPKSRRSPGPSSGKRHGAAKRRPRSAASAAMKHWHDQDPLAGASAGASAASGVAGDHLDEDTSKALLEKNMNEIEKRMVELQNNGQYLEAAEVRDRLRVLRESVRTRSANKWIDKHTNTIQNLDSAKSRGVSDVVSFWDQRIEALKQETEDKIARVTRRQRAEVELFAQAMQRQRRATPIKYSSAVIRLEREERSLARAHLYEKAATTQQLADHLKEQESAKLSAAAMQREELRLRRLEAQHAREVEVMQQKANIKLAKMCATRDKEIRHLDIRFRSASNQLQHARNLQVVSSSSMSPMVNDAAESASKRGEQAAVAATFLLRDRSPASSRRARPSTAPGVRAGSKVARRRPKTAQARTRSQFNGSNGALSRSRRSKGRKSKSKKRGKGRRSASTRDCWWCGGVRGFISEIGGVSIPKEGSEIGVGIFCCWECAKSWNFKYMPTQLRRISDMFICDVAGYTVPHSEKRHVPKVRRR